MSEKEPLFDLLIEYEPEKKNYRARIKELPFFSLNGESKEEVRAEALRLREQILKYATP